MNWVDKLILEYEQGRRELKKMYKNAEDKAQKKEINSMISDMTFSIEWMKNGSQPDIYLGIDKKGAYQKDHFDNMDMFPSLDVVPERRLTEEEKQAIFLKLIKLTARERQCFIMREGYLWKLEDIADELGISKPAVHKTLERAKRKLSLAETA
ncbi:sigma-70 family RNA polymerase sigma factor [Virgibacillus salexigens]|uniref:sigma-70 family RNA polymerase sigma factor n=1 Tax=Virgibacillus salexigens TaxID=61016 RepID=UPI00190A5514|nr:sigma-70 family RNA polymerase sigma factor [Virgibacillus salexigens]